MQLTQYKKPACIAVALLVVGFAFGRYSAPEKVRIETKTVTVASEATDQDKKENETIVKTELINKDGSKEIITKTQDNTATDTKELDTVNTETTQSKEVTRSASKVTVSVLAGYKFSNLTPVYGVSITKPILGPVTVGLWGMSDVSGGVSVGLEF